VGVRWLDGIALVNSGVDRDRLSTGLIIVIVFRYWRSGDELSHSRVCVRALASLVGGGDDGLPGLGIQILLAQETE